MTGATAKPTLLAAGLAFAAALTLTGCTGGSAPSASADRTSNGAPTTPSGAALPDGVVGATAVPTGVPNNPGLRGNVTMSSCAARSGGWGASGTVHNPDAQAARYRITVFFTTDHATVIGFAATTVSLAAKETKTWSVSATMHAATPTLCVLRGVG